MTVPEAQHRSGPVDTESTDVVIVGGGQSGLAAAAIARAAGLHPVLLERSADAVGSWPRYYDHLRLFSPARYCGLPGLPFPGRPDRYPVRDEIVSYLQDYRSRLDADIRTGHQVRGVSAAADGFLLHTTTGQLHARILIAATGMFGNPHIPRIPGTGFTGRVLHAAEYRNPGPFLNQQVVVILFG